MENQNKEFFILDRQKYYRGYGDIPNMREDDPSLTEILHYRILDYFLFSSIQGKAILNSIFSNKIHRVGTWDASTYGDPHTEYRQNSYGFRGDEFPGQVDMITAGCSQTVGIGVPEETVWHEVLAKDLGVSHVNIAAAGWSISQIVESVMWYIRQHGKPKKIVLLLPDFARGHGVFNQEILVDPKTAPLYEETGSKIYLSKYDVNAAETYPKISKRPHVPNDVFPPEMTVYLSAQAFASFIEYCRVGEIELIWGSWNNSAITVFEILEDIKTLAKDQYVLDEIYQDANRAIEEGMVDTSGMVDIDLSTWNGAHVEKLKRMNCHQELKEKYPLWFDVGTDEQKHYGVHAHAHVAEKFYQKITEKDGQ